MTAALKNWMALTEGELREYVAELGLPAFRGTQLFEMIHRQHKRPEEASNLPGSLWEKLPYEAPLEIEASFDSQKDETKKMLYRLSDGHLVEGVLLSYEHGYSLCVSTQVGCRMGCKFCYSTVGGLMRSLTPEEMLFQVYETERSMDITIGHVILMGSGEPLDNYHNVIQFLKVLHEEKGKFMSYRNMTISTCGVVPGILALSEEEIPVGLAISLHETDQKRREALMPVTKAYPLRELMGALKTYQERTGQRITMEYTLIEGENDRRENMEALAAMAQELFIHVNLIPLNPTEHYGGQRPDKYSIHKFKDQLSRRGISCTIRRELGSDIAASCGQLKAGYENGIKGVIQ
ncbi:MAG: 23S rRNA (adenine(2503)-C(2))-methyltransferase RlmN [Tissierellia bacterium]|nr:23S rRNA (adenine(2503)-C(2))-methyltransferase RlmN [Tissierellia bacterium]